MSGLLEKSRQAKKVLATDRVLKYFTMNSIYTVDVLPFFRRKQKWGGCGFQTASPNSILPHYRTISVNRTSSALPH